MTRNFLRRLKGLFGKKQSLGTLGERAGAKFLKKQGYRIIETNYRTRYGEIDIIAEDGDTLVFVEVKTRRTDDPNYSPFLNVRFKKQRKITQLARFYCDKRNIYDKPIRFDVLGVTQIESAEPKFELIQGAFGERRF